MQQKIIESAKEESPQVADILGEIFKKRWSFTQQAEIHKEHYFCVLFEVQTQTSRKKSTLLCYLRVAQLPSYRF